MIVYNYDSVTGEYLSSSLADANPLEPGQFLIPAFATEVAPPLPADGHRAIFSSGVWTELPVEFVAPLDSPPPTLEEVKQTKRNKIAEDREASLDAGFFLPSVNKTVDSDAQSRENIMLAAQLALLPGAPASVDWRMQDNSTVTLTASQVLQMAAALGDHVRQVYQISWNAKAAVEAAQTVEAVQAI
jgi:hypothetical protein